ncbi:MAG: hypothetical protein GX804_06445 [Lentisphaerae bacterium]|nr:hypothetical protein [Lentisphaerota bacterium]
MDPASWVPPIPSNVSHRSMVAFRPLQMGDTTQVTIRAGSLDPVEIVDIVDIYGNITLPHLGEFKVGQLTTSEAEKAVANAYVENKIFSAPIITIVSPNLQHTPEIFITGEIQKKGSFVYKDGITLWQAIVAAGDVTAYASNKVKLVRNGIATEYDIRKIKKNVSENPVLMPGDIIEVMARLF